MEEAERKKYGKILAGIASDIFAFLPYVRLQEPGELSLEFELWPHLKDFLLLLQKNKLILLLKAKQIGISWLLAVYALWQIYTIPGWNVLMISKGEKEAQALLEKCRIVYRNLPQWMKVWTIDPDSKSQFGFREMGSKITAYPSTLTAGIGETAGLVIHDESDFHEHYDVNLSHTSATVADSPDRQLVSVSTVDKWKPDSIFKNDWKRARDGLNNFTVKFYGYDVRPSRDAGWYKRMAEDTESWVMEGNYPRTADEALSPLAAVSCFNHQTLQSLWDCSVDIPPEKNHVYILQSWRAGVAYAAGIDVGEGVGLDYSCLTIVGKQGLSSEVVAVIYTNTLGTAEFAYDSYELCEKYKFPQLIVDNIGIGRAVIDKLVEMGYPKLYKMNETKYGYALSRPNKRELVTKLVETVNNSSLVTRFKPQIQELMEYQWINGYPEPTGKTHGDTIIALMFANMLLPKLGGAREASFYVHGKKVW